MKNVYQYEFVFSFTNIPAALRAYV